jgi:thioredoxin-like negative regulator of GroEL
VNLPNTIHAIIAHSTLLSFSRFAFATSVRQNKASFLTMIKEAKSLVEFAEATSLGPKQLVLVELFAESEGSHSKSSAELEQISESTNVPLVRVNIHKVEEVAHVLDVTTVPSVTLVRNGNKIETIINEDPHDIETKIRQYSL